MIADGAQERGNAPAVWGLNFGQQRPQLDGIRGQEHRSTTGEWREQGELIPGCQAGTRPDLGQVQSAQELRWETVPPGLGPKPFDGVGYGGRALELKLQGIAAEQLCV